MRLALNRLCVGWPFKVGHFCTAKSAIGFYFAYLQQGAETECRSIRSGMQHFSTDLASAGFQIFLKGNGTAAVGTHRKHAESIALIPAHAQPHFMQRNS